MKRFCIGNMILILLLSLCGCERKAVDGNTLFVSDTIPTEIYTTDDPFQRGKEQRASEQILYEGYEKLSEEQLAGISIEKAEGDTIYRYDPELYSSLPFREPGNVCYSEVPPLPYSELMEKIGTDGIIAAGYATGLRESHDSEWDSSYTLVDFVITDLYYGNETATAIKIKESHNLVLKDNYAYFSIPIISSTTLKNDRQVLLFLWKDTETEYYTKVYTIPLAADYRDYNDSYLTSMLDFFRGDKTEYRNQDTATGVQPAPSTVVDGETVYTHDLIPTFFWPEREISDEALLAEMSDHVVVRTATEYKIAIWPYGHKNYTGGYGTSPFHRSCKP